MSKEKKTKKVNFEIIGYASILIIGTIAIITGIMFIPKSILTGVLLIGIGICMTYIFKLYCLILKITNLFEDVVDRFIKIEKSLSSNINHRPYPPSFLDNIPSFPDITKIEISDTTSPEELDKLKKEHPEMSKLIDTILQQSKVYSPFLPNSPLYTDISKDIKNMTLDEMKAELEKAVKEEKFELAGALRDEIVKRS